MEPVTDGLTVAELAARQDQISAVVATLAKTVERLSAPAGAGTISPPDRRPRDIDGAELVDWVRWLAERNELAVVLPGCWPSHGAIVEELAALYVGWQTVGVQGGGLTRAQWHDYFDRALARIDGRWRTCPDGTHRTPEPADWLETGPVGAENIDLRRSRFTLT